MRHSSMSRICCPVSAVLKRSICEGKRVEESIPCLANMISTVSWSVCGGSEAGLEGGGWEARCAEWW